MGIREAISKKSKVSTIVVVCVIAICCVVIALEIRGPDNGPPKNNFFTTDNGKTWFVASVKNLPPFDHNGAPAVRCFVFQGKNGKFAGLLEKYSDDALKQLATATARPQSIPIMVKKPGEKEWQHVGPDQEAAMIMAILGPPDSGVERIMP